MLPNDFSSLYDWSPAARVSYGDFLCAKHLGGALRYAIDNQYKEAIATNQQLSGRGIEVVSVNLERGFTMLSQQVRQGVEAGKALGSPAPSAGTGALNPTAAASADTSGTFHWGYSEVLISQGLMNLEKDELGKLAKTPPQIRAYEQFVLARDEFRQQLYKEALQSASRAIEGMGEPQGNNSEFRFYFLLGTIRLGSHRNIAPELINPQLAEQAFLAAARYAESGYPTDAGQALICAGRAALVAGNIEDAIAHTRKGLILAPSHAAGMYQLGRALCLKGISKEAAERLTDAVLLDPEHALHACGDPEFVAKADFLTGLMRHALERYETRYKQIAERYQRALHALRDFSFMEVSADRLKLTGVAEIQEVPKSAAAMAASKTLFGYSDAIDQHLGGFRLLPTWFEAFKAHCVQRLREMILQPPRREDYLPANSSAISESSGGVSKAGLASGVVSGITVFLFESFQMAKPIYRGILESMSELFLIPVLTAVGITAVVVVAQDMYREYVRSNYKSALAAFEAARYTYNNLKTSLEEEISTIQRMSLPKEFLPPSQANAAKPGAPADAVAASKRASAWTTL